MSLVPLASLLLAIGLSMGVAAQVTGALCLSGWEWVCDHFPLEDIPQGMSKPRVWRFILSIDTVPAEPEFL